MEPASATGSSRVLTPVTFCFNINQTESLSRSSNAHFSQPSNYRAFILKTLCHFFFFIFLNFANLLFSPPSLFPIILPSLFFLVFFPVFGSKIGVAQVTSPMLSKQLKGRHGCLPSPPLSSPLHPFLSFRHSPQSHAITFILKLPASPQQRVEVT